MQFKKLFQVLVVGGAMAGAVAATACSQANAQDKAKKPAPADAGTKDSSAGGGVKGW
jgi:flavin-dependent dehydrogenase